MLVSIPLIMAITATDAKILMLCLNSLAKRLSIPPQTFLIPISSPVVRSNAASLKSKSLTISLTFCLVSRLTPSAALYISVSSAITVVPINIMIIIT